MSRKTNPTAVGVFVIGAILLLIMGIMIFGSGKLLSRKVPWVLYFDESIKGLRVGAPVNFRGVKIGSVNDIKVTFDPKDNSIRTPVYIEIEPDRITPIGKEPVKEDLMAKVLDAIFEMELTTQADRSQAIELIQRGLRARLEMQSFVTGQLSIGLDFHPDTPITLHKYQDPYPEFPTIPTSFEELTAKLEDIPLEDLVNGILRAVTGIERLVNAPELLDAIRSLQGTMDHVQGLSKTLDTRVVTLADSIEATLVTARNALQQAETTLAMKEGASGELAANLHETLEATRAAMDQAQVTFTLQEGPAAQLIKDLRATAKTMDKTFIQAKDTLSTAKGIVDENSGLRYELGNTLEELSAAARSIRNMAEYLERHPEALIHGKGESREN
ncbi:MlaD family protein [Candidatus Nitronereus thalassa]|uniref:MlaD family protein n=1 Tax=Candidatus Nitronereus thalassa TaxID=3020898 RepID=A0ABU3K9M2_9BACT|nr:MlaD family protein [Candidatus Nitronereus thalassa]MDT7043115.1 MlaD family protein [Candidatus Nitronereus thalassa]